MRKVVIFLLLIFTTSLGYGADNCLKVAQSLWNLQNQIVKKSFEQLTPGAWAQYQDGSKVIYLGKRISPKTGKKLFVVEYQGKQVGQIWYKVTPKEITYQGQSYRFKTLEPMEAYALMRGKSYYIPKEMIETYMRMGGHRWSTILEEGTISSPPNCDHVPELRETVLNFPGGKKIKATVIISTENKSKIVCSPDVPFGMIKVVSSLGRISYNLKNFNFKGGKAKISNKMLKEAVPMSFFPQMKNLGKLPFNFPSVR